MLPESDRHRVVFRKTLHARRRARAKPTPRSSPARARRCRSMAARSKADPARRLPQWPHRAVRSPAAASGRRERRSPSTSPATPRKQMNDVERDEISRLAHASQHAQRPRFLSCGCELPGGSEPVQIRRTKPGACGALRRAAGVRWIMPMPIGRSRSRCRRASRPSTKAPARAAHAQGLRQSARRTRPAAQPGREHGRARR